MSLIAALRWRYATKKFDPDKIITEPIVDGLLEMANLSATSYGLQPFQFIVIRNQELQDRLIASSYGQRQVADASHVIVIATRTDVDESYIRDYVGRVEVTRELPKGELSSYGNVVAGAIGQMSDESRQQWAAKQAYLILGTLLAACASLEIDSCPMEGFVPEEYSELLELNSKNLHATIVLPIGYRADDDAAQHLTKVRKPMPEMIIHP